MEENKEQDIWRSKSKDLTFDMTGCFSGVQTYQKNILYKKKLRERQIEMERKRVMRVTGAVSARSLANDSSIGTHMSMSVGPTHMHLLHFTVYPACNYFVVLSTIGPIAFCDSNIVCNYHVD